MNRVWCRALMLLGLAVPVVAAAAPEEIQVYLDDKEGPGKTSVDWHNNLAVSGRSTPDYPGERPPAHVYRLTPELNVGWTDTLELGLYVLTSRDPGGDWHGDGAKVRLKYIAPHDTSQGLYGGLNLEVGKSALAVQPLPWEGELKGILGWRNRQWTLGVNLNLDGSLDRKGGPVTADLDVKVSRVLTEKTQIGVESYNELGPLSHLQSAGRNSKTLFAVVDTDVAGFDLNAGLGRGLTTESDRWTLKFILSTPF